MTLSMTQRCSSQRRVIGAPAFAHRLRNGGLRSGSAACATVAASAVAAPAADATSVADCRNSRRSIVFSLSTLSGETYHSRVASGCSVFRQEPRARSAAASGARGKGLADEAVGARSAAWPADCFDGRKASRRELQVVITNRSAEAMEARPLMRPARRANAWRIIRSSATGSTRRRASCSTASGARRSCCSAASASPSPSIPKAAIPSGSSRSTSSRACWRRRNGSCCRAA